MSLLAGAVQPAVLTILSSTSTPAISPLWRVVEGESERSFVDVLRDDAYPGTGDGIDGRGGSSSKRGFAKSDIAKSDIAKSDIAKSRANSPSPPSVVKHVPRHRQVGSLPVPVIHIQSPRPDTYLGTRGTLGVTLPYIGAQFKALGHRGLGLEVALVDAMGRRGVVRFSSWKKSPSLHASRSPPLLHLPLAMPDDAHKVTDWAELSIYLPAVMALFRSLRPEEEEEEEDSDEPEQYRPQAHWRGRDGYNKQRRGYAAPKRPRTKYDLPGAYASTAAVRVYASCRLRRVWFSAEGDRSLDAAGVRDEWALYAE